MMGMGKKPLIVHHLDDSRSQRVLWLLEELGLRYEIVEHRRDPQTRLAPPSLKAVHPLGKSPVLQDGDRVIAESGAILDYLVRRHGKGRLAPKPSEPAYDLYQQFMHYAEGSAMLPLMLKLYVGRLGEAGAPLHPRIESEIANHLDFLEGAIKDRDWLLGRDFSAADVQISFVVEVARQYGELAGRPGLDAYLNRLHARPAYGRALARGGPYRYGPSQS